MGKLDGKVAVITGASTGMALAGAKLFVDEGAHVFITGRRQEALDEAVKLIEITFKASVILSPRKGRWPSSRTLGRQAVDAAAACARGMAGRALP